MRKIIVGSLCMALISAPFLYAQDAATPTPEVWKIQFETGIGLTQTSYSDSWLGGEAGSVVWMANYLGKAEKQITPVWLSTNSLKLEFGQTHSQDELTNDWAKPRKSADKIRFDGLIRLTQGWVVDPYGAVTLESQFLDASSPINKRYINPIDLTESMGLARRIFLVENVREMTMRAGFGLKQRIIDSDDPVDPTKTISKTDNSGGFEWVTDLTIGTAKSKAGFNSKLTFFQAIINSQADDLKGLPNEDYWKTVDLNWDNILRLNFTSLLQMNLAWQLLYDKEVSLKGRFKETLSLGISYKFANFK